MKDQEDLLQANTHDRRLCFYYASTLRAVIVHDSDVVLKESTFDKLMKFFQKNEQQERLFRVVTNAATSLQAEYLRQGRQADEGKVNLIIRSLFQRYSEANASHTLLTQSKTANIDLEDSIDSKERRAIQQVVEASLAGSDVLHIATLIENKHHYEAEDLLNEVKDLWQNNSEESEFTKIYIAALNLHRDVWITSRRVEKILEALTFIDNLVAKFPLNSKYKSDCCSLAFNSFTRALDEENLDFANRIFQNLEMYAKKWSMEIDPVGMYASAALVFIQFYADRKQDEEWIKVLLNAAWAIQSNEFRRTFLLMQGEEEYLELISWINEIIVTNGIPPPVHD